MDLSLNMKGERFGSAIPKVRHSGYYCYNNPNPNTVLTLT